MRWVWFEGVANEVGVVYRRGVVNDVGVVKVRLVSEVGVV